MGSSSYIKLAAFIDGKRATINPQNSDQQCFKWVILARHVSVQSKYYVGESYRQNENKYNFNGIYSSQRHYPM